MSLKKRPSYRFDEFHLDAGERLLKRGESPVPIAPKVFDVLILLLEHAGRLVDRATLRERIWDGQVVEESTIARLIADLRKALGDVGNERRYIETVPKFGYRFVAAVSISADETDAPPAQCPEPLEPRPEAARRLWNRKRTMGVALILAFLAGLGLAGNRLLHRGPAEGPRVQSLLITPFETIGHVPEIEVLRLGLQDSLAVDLSSLSRFSVLKSSSERPTLAEDAAEIGRRRKATFVLTGTVEYASNRIQVNARLLRSDTGQALWAHTFDETLDDVLKIQSRLAQVTATALIPALPASEGERMARRQPANPLAYRYYLLGRHYWNKREESAYAEAIRMFEKAVAADPRYAPALVGLADTYLLAASHQRDPLKDALPPAEAAIEQAIRIDPDLGEAHATLALIAESYRFDTDKAEREFQTAIRVSPNYATAHHWYAEFLTMIGKFDLADAEFEVARNLDPASPIIATDLAQLYYFEKRYDRSLQTLDEVLALDSSFHLAHNRRGWALMLEHRPKAALQEFRAARSAGQAASICEQAWVAAVEGRRQQALRLARQAAREDPDLLMLGIIWAVLGESDRAMDFLDRAYDSRTSGLISLKFNPALEPLRSQPRFQSLLQKMRLAGAS